MNKENNIGLFGYGCVGQGLHDVLNDSHVFKSEIKQIVVKNREKQRRLAPEIFSFERDIILRNDNIDLVVELIDNVDEARQIVLDALRNNKSVVSANKKLIAENFQELLEVQRETGRALLYEAAVCGGIPILRTLEEYYDNELLNKLTGIVNGSSNYILSKIQQEGKTYISALQEAQALGFAETDPALDVGGYDAKYKAVILALHGFGIVIKPEYVVNQGIQNLTEQDIEFARSRGAKIKLIANIGRTSDNQLYCYVLPQLVFPNDILYSVENEFNGIRVEAAFSDAQYFIGKGAGGHPTGSAVLSDISASQYDYRYAYKKWNSASDKHFTNSIAVKIYLRSNSFSPLVFDKIEEKGDHYQIGWVALSELLLNKDYLEKEAFVLAL